MMKRNNFDVTDRELSVIEGSRGMFVLLLYTNYCPICSQMSDELREVADRLGIQAGQIDMLHNARAVGKFVPTGVPTLVIFKDGVITARHKGKVDIETVVSMKI